ncbi:MAG TPA: shikimate kinase [Candidatus Nitrosotenuis sp.]|nr:shikimate kinase [Candidatus Nitrosotenuis sp.]
MQLKATVHGAISIVNAIATWKGATLGIDSKVEAVMRISDGRGIYVESDNKSLSSRLINKVIELSVPKKDLEKNRIELSINSEIPTGYGLKSSSAISTVVSLACHKAFKKHYSDTDVLNAGIDASLATKVSMTGAFDDACACYFGGTIVTDNKLRKIIRMQRTPTDLGVVIFIPQSRKRGNVKKLRNLPSVFERAWMFAKDGEYWSAMILNGLATSHILRSNPQVILRLVEKGALGASISGNGPAVAAVAKKNNINNIKRVFSDLEGKVITAAVNNKKADVNEL